ncbi:pleckstrin homology domain-containing family M member 1 isoform X2 [Thalassophryne amazonica]|uniref:pleckstrin homology domain-containing family M member 1 isoform X2 n=1 Tax=Thalassophryne amazonica TaxID=390379 RepID=UPI001470A6C1|nr:pleckstrin homology domain-containing family M member 1 isoform X2 [Thalassophryne amazonica]
MLATQSTDTPPEAKHVKQIKEKLVQSLKALQKRYITSDALVTSDDGDANLLCCALEALFIHGIKSKYIRSDTGSRSRKGERGLLPQPFFWGLLKTVTHGNVVSELEKLNFVSTDVGRCRAWLRLALNDGLLDCYLTSLFRENSKLRAHYQPNALLLNTEEREVLLSYLQGLDSLTFSLSYKSAVLNDWTTTPLALAGLCPPLQADTFDLPLNGGDPATTTCKESWDTVSQSSSLSDALDMQNGCPAVERDANIMRSSMIMLNSSNLSLATTGSSQLSSSLSSDGLLQGQDPRSPTGEQWSSCDLEVSLNISATKPAKDTLGEFRESGTCSQDSMREDSFVSSTGQDLSETAIFSSSDSETQGPTTPFQDLSDQAPNIALSNSEPQTSSAPQLSKECLVNPSPSDVCILASSEMHLHADTLSKVSDRDDSEETVQAVNAQHGNEVVEKAQKSGKAPSSESSVHQVPCRTTSILRRNGSLDLLSRPHSWISDDDIYKPHQLEVSDIDESPTADLSAPIPEPNITQSPPSVVHRRQIGCTQQIGPSRGRARLCEFSGQYYCDSCHQGDTTIIPARMVHNWDITQREVSRKALHLLAEIEHEPLLNLELLNPELVKHAEPMGQAHGLRQRLRLLGEYLLTCHSRAYKKLQSRIKQRTYLMESSHLYSVMDLRQIAEGHYVTYLETLVHYASDHVYHCDLCTQRGFICQMCHSDDIIFPFQFDSTTRCKQCKAVFHLTCKVPPRSCPRCVRMKKYLERDLQD